jgi:hypothetical protein
MLSETELIYIAIGILVLLIISYFIFWRPAVKPVIVSERLVSAPLNCSNSMAAAKTYYDTQSEYATVFMMDPISSVASGTNTCDIKYTYTPVPGTARTDSGLDFRRFTYDNTGAVYDMSTQYSGTLNP